MITVRDVWRGALPEGTELLAGGAGLDRRVEWATALRSKPPAFEAVKGGEIAFVPVRAIRVLDPRLDLDAVLESFAEKGGVGVAIIGAPSAGSLSVADRLMLPLLQLPEGTSATDAQQTAVRFILDQRTQLHERAQEIQAELMELALGGAGAEAIAGRLAEITGLGVAWQDIHGAVRHSAGALPGGAARLSAADDEIHRWTAGMTVLAADPPVREFDAGEGAARLVAPIAGRGSIGGYLSVVGDPRALGQLARLAVSRAAAACAIQLDREQAVLAVRDDLEGEVAEALLAGSYGSDHAIIERARRLRCPVEGELRVAVLRAPRGEIGGEALIAARRWAERREIPALITRHRGSLCILLAGEERIDSRALGELHEQCSAAAATPLDGGGGRAHRGPGGVRTSHREAEQALTMGRRLHGGGQLTDFADLGLDRLLFAVAAMPELHDFQQATLGVLAEYDERSSGDLLRTLDAFFACHGSPTEMAQRLHVHRNTVLYRLRRIEEVGHLQLDDAATRLNLHLSLRIRDVLHAGAGAQALAAGA